MSVNLRFAEAGNCCYLTAVADGLDALFEEYMALLSKYGYGRGDAPPGARLMQLRMFYLPDEPADPTAGS
jgi:hypothetical protein